MNNFNATTKNAINIVSDMLYINIGDEKNIGDHQKVLLIISSLYTGSYAAFSGVHFKLERTSCQQSLKYISLYNTGGAPFSTEKRNIFLST